MEGTGEGDGGVMCGECRGKIRKTKGTVIAPVIIDGGGSSKDSESLQHKAERPGKTKIEKLEVERRSRVRRTRAKLYLEKVVRRS